METILHLLKSKHLFEANQMKTFIIAPALLSVIAAVFAPPNCPNGRCPLPQMRAAMPLHSSTRYITPAEVISSVEVLPSKTTTTKTAPSTSYQARWTNNDGLSPRDHAVLAHGFDPSLSDAQLAAMHDAYPDQYGGTNPAGQYRSYTSTTYTIQPTYAARTPIRNILRNRPVRRVLRNVFCR